MYRPVDQLLNISRIANVKAWFPNLAQIARLDEQEPLLFMHQVCVGVGQWCRCVCLVRAAPGVCRCAPVVPPCVFG